MIDNFATFSDEIKYELLQSLSTEFPEIKFMDNAAHYSIQNEPPEFKICKIKLTYNRDNQTVSINGLLAVSLYYGSPNNIEIDSGRIRNFLLGVNRKIFTTANYKVWFDLSHDYDVDYFPEFREFQAGSIYNFRATKNS